jgi:hypothetical protein
VSTWGEKFWWGWQVATVVTSATGVRLAGKRKSVGWVVCLMGSLMWMTYGLGCAEIGALLNGIVFGGIYMWNLTDWTQAHGTRTGKLIWLLWFAIILGTFTVS